MKSAEFEAAMLAAQQNKIHEWVLSFLRASGNNPGLADKLEKDGHNYYGPIEYPIKDIVNILGPDKSFKYQETETSLNERVDKIIAAILAGWQAPPLLATNLWEDYLELADGGHRYRAFQKLGIEKYPTIFYFRDQSTKEAFISKL
jgi:hypothetical protein